MLFNNSLKPESYLICKFDHLDRAVTCTTLTSTPELFTAPPGGVDKCSGYVSVSIYLVLPRLSSRAHFILLAPLPPLVDKAPPPCPPGDAMATNYTAGPRRQKAPAQIGCINNCRCKRLVQLSVKPKTKYENKTPVDKSLISDIEQVSSFLSSPKGKHFNHLL